MLSKIVIQIHNWLINRFFHNSLFRVVYLFRVAFFFKSFLILILQNQLIKFDFIHVFSHIDQHIHIYRVKLGSLCSYSGTTCAEGPFRWARCALHAEIFPHHLQIKIKVILSIWNHNSIVTYRYSSPMFDSKREFHRSLPRYNT